MSFDNGLSRHFLTDEGGTLSIVEGVPSHFGLGSCLSFCHYQGIVAEWPQWLMTAPNYVARIFPRCWVWHPNITLWSNTTGSAHDERDELSAKPYVVIHHPYPLGLRNPDPYPVEVGRTGETHSCCSSILHQALQVNFPSCAHLPLHNPL